MDNEVPVSGLARGCWTAMSRAVARDRNWVASSGNVTDEVWKEYIKNQKPPDPEDNFDVV